MSPSGFRNQRNCLLPCPRNVENIRGSVHLQLVSVHVQLRHVESSACHPFRLCVVVFRSNRSHALLEFLQYCLRVQDQLREEVCIVRKILVSLTWQTSWALISFFIFFFFSKKKKKRRVRPLLLEMLRLPIGSVRRSCCGRCLVVGMDAVVAIVLSVAVDVAGGESVRNMSVLRGWNVRRCCGRFTCRCRPRCL